MQVVVKPECSALGLELALGLSLRSVSQRAVRLMSTWKQSDRPVTLGLELEHRV